MKKNIIPGFKLTLGFTIFYLSLILVIPISLLFFQASKLSFSQILETITHPRVLSALKLSFTASFAAAIINTIFGFLTAWIIVRYNFFGKKIIDAFVDLPFALPTAVAGISLTTLFAKNGWLGKYFNQFGIEIAYTQLGIVVALIFVGIPFVVRIVQPVLEDLDKEVEEAAVSLNANRIYIFRKIIFPEVKPALIAGFTSAFARALGEYGSVVFISGNIPLKTEITPFLIMTKLEQYDYTGATAIACVMMLFSFILLLILNSSQKFGNKFIQKLKVKYAE